MNNKEFINNLANRLKIKPEEAQILSNTLIEIMTHGLEDGNIISVQGFGTFEVKKNGKNSSKSFKQTTHVGSPKLVLNFKPSNTLKKNINNLVKLTYTTYKQ